MALTYLIIQERSDLTTRRVEYRHNTCPPAQLLSLGWIISRWNKVMIIQDRSGWLSHILSSYLISSLVLSISVSSIYWSRGSSHRLYMLYENELNLTVKSSVQIINHQAVLHSGLRNTHASTSRIPSVKKYKIASSKRKLGCASAMILL